MADLDFTGKAVGIAGRPNMLESALARRFAEAGASVALVIHDPKECQGQIDAFQQEYGQIDVWINIASLMYTGPAESITPDQWNVSLSTMLSGTFYYAQAAGRYMLARGQGVIINVTATDAYHPIEGRIAFSTASAGIVALTQALGIEWAKRGVRVVGLAVGPLTLEEQLPEETRRVYERRTPLHRFGTVDEVAEAALFLASDQASYIVGETLRVDGGWTAYQLF